jgi:hypothetical protein
MFEQKSKNPQKTVSSNLRELKQEASIVLSEIRDAENQAKLAVIKELILLKQLLRLF